MVTAIPFGLGMTGLLPTGTTILLVLACCLAQILAHLWLFLHFDSCSEQGWSVITAVFTAVIVTGSFRIMHHLDSGLMLQSPESQRGDSPLAHSHGG